MLTAAILTKNNEATLSKCLGSLEFCDRILIVDNYSTDKTPEIAKKAGATIFQKKLDNDFAALRNFAMEKADEGWILFIDADEVVPDALAKEIQDAVKTDAHLAYFLRRQDVFLGKKLKWGEVRKAYAQGIIRLVKKGSGSWEGNVHEELKTSGSVGQLSSILQHFPHPTIADFLNDINEYSSIRAQELQIKRMPIHVLQIMFFPPLKFIYTYFLNLGFLDGPEGFIYSFMMSFHLFLVRSKLYLLQKDG